MRSHNAALSIAPLLDELKQQKRFKKIERSLKGDFFYHKSTTFSSARLYMYLVCCRCRIDIKLKQRVGLYFPLNGNRANVYAHVAMVRVHVWRTVCSVCATGARVAQSFCRFLRFHRRRSRCCFKSLSMWTGTGWIEFPTEWILHKRARARSGAQCACLAHGLQCLRDGRACCPSLPTQLVICRFLRFHRRRSRCCFKSLLWPNLFAPNPTTTRVIECGYQ